MIPTCPCVDIEEMQRQLSDLAETVARRGIDERARTDQLARLIYELGSTVRLFRRLAIATATATVAMLVTVALFVLNVAAGGSR